MQPTRQQIIVVLRGRPLLDPSHSATLLFIFTRQSALEYQSSGLEPHALGCWCIEGLLARTAAQALLVSGHIGAVTSWAPKQWLFTLLGGGRVKREG